MKDSREKKGKKKKIGKYQEPQPNLSRDVSKYGRVHRRLKM
jgi:hypothetical protein